MRANVKASVEFLSRWLPEGPWCLTAIPFDRATGTVTKTFYPGDQVEKWIQEQNDDQRSGIYFIPNEVRYSVSTKARREDMGALICLHVDVDPRAGEDIEREQARIRALALSDRPAGLPAPSAVIFSGGGFQLLWRLATPEPIEGIEDAERLKRYNIQIEHLLGGDHCHDVCRLLRLPGTVNWPTPKKMRAGRKPVLAEVIAFWDERLYSLSSFTPAPELQDNVASVSGRSKEFQVAIPGNVRRLESVDELGEAVPGLTKVVIVQGHDPDNPARFGGDRSSAVWHVVSQLLRSGIEDDVIFSIITDPGFGISAHVLDQPNSDKYAQRQIERAKEDAVDPDLREFNERFAVITNYSGKCVIAEEAIDPETGFPDLRFQSYDAFRQAFAPRRKKKRTKKEGEKEEPNKADSAEDMPIALWWFNNPQRREYRDVIFVPNRHFDGYYNCWSGFTVKATPGDCTLFLAHVRENLCLSNEAYYDYLLNWMAFAVQRPEERAQIAVVLKGGQGTGKSFFAETFGYLFGRHFTAIRNPVHLVGQFNAHLRHCVFLFADEAFFAGERRHEGIMKGLITEERLLIERKGVDVTQQANRLHILIASNEYWAVPAGLDDRRFFILQVGEAQKQNASYFRKIKQQMVSGGYEALMNLLMTRDLSKFDITCRPETTALKEEKVNSLPLVERWWYDCLIMGEISVPGSSWGGSWPKRPVPCRQIWNAIQETLPFSEKLSNSVLGRRFRRLLPPTLIDFRPYAGISWTDRMGDHVSRECFVFPPLKECREWWDEKIGELGPWREPFVEEARSEDDLPF